MANSVTTQILANTDRKLVIQRVMYSDGTEETKEVMVDISASAYNSSGGKAMTGVAVEKVTITNMPSGTMKVGWDSTNLYPFITCVGGSAASSGPGMYNIDYGSEWGGLTKDNITVDAGTAAGSGTPTGDIAITTTSFDSGEGYVVTLVMRKIF